MIGAPRKMIRNIQGFPYAVYTWEGQVQGDKALMGGGTHEGDIDLMGGLTLIDYIIN